MAHNNLGIFSDQPRQARRGDRPLSEGAGNQARPGRIPNNLGNVLSRRDRIDEAIAQYQKALEINPDYMEAHNNLGNAFARLGRFEEAMAQYRKALEIKPDYVEAHYNLGVTFARLGRIDEAIAQYRKALEIKPDYADALNNLGYALFGRGGRMRQ